MSTCTIPGIIRWQAGTTQEVSDELAEEEPLEIRVRSRSISVTMRTPGADDELAAGFLLTEGVIRRRQDVLRIEPCERNEFGNLINVLLAPGVAVDFERLTRHVFAASSCGLCGKASIEAIAGKFERIPADSAVVQAQTLASLPAIMRNTQSAFDRTGGLHAAALFTAGGELIVLREDVGRHNAVDKVLGHALLHEQNINELILLVSGRSSFEIMQKALAGRVPIVAAVSAPSSLAVTFARENNQTLVGFLRDQRMNIYSGSERITF